MNACLDFFLLAKGLKTKYSALVARHSTLYTQHSTQHSTLNTHQYVLNDKRYRVGSENEGIYGANADVWSLGVTVGEMLTGYLPYDDLSNPFAVMFKLSREPDYTLSSISQSLKASSPYARCFVEQCLVRSPSARPSSAQMAQHPFLVDL
jgi:serine/threonine protein kinase